MVELVYTADLKSAAFGIVGSSPTTGTNERENDPPSIDRSRKEKLSHL
jgi:hypothetical protein